MFYDFWDTRYLNLRPLDFPMLNTSVQTFHNMNSESSYYIDSVTKLCWHHSHPYLNPIPAPLSTLINF